MEVIIAVVLVVAVLAFVVKKKHDGHVCNKDCANCPNPCHHKR